MRTDCEVNLHLLYVATQRRLAHYADLVRENRQVYEALDFARYVLNSGMLPLLAAHDTRADLPAGDLKIDSSLLRFNAEELQRACTERFRLNDSKPHLEALQLQSINQKLDTIAGYLGKFAVPNGAGASVPELKVISGGLEESPVLERRRATT